MKSVFWCVAVLSACIGSPLQTSAVAPNNSAPAPTTPEAWTNEIVKWLEDIVNIPTTVPKLPWYTLAWDVLKYRSGEYNPLISKGKVLKRTTETYLSVLDDRNHEPLLDALKENPIKRSFWSHHKHHGMLYALNFYFLKLRLPRFIKTINKAIDNTKNAWSNTEYQKRLSFLTAKKTGLDHMINRLKKAQSQFVGLHDASIKHSSDMEACRILFAQNMGVNDVNTYQNNYRTQARHWKKKADPLILPIKTTYSQIQSVQYPKLTKNQKQDVLAKNINILKNNIASLSIFLKETINCDSFASEKEKLGAIKAAGSKILVFTPEIIGYLTRAYQSLDFLIKNHMTNKTLVDDHIAKITQAISG